MVIGGGEVGVEAGMHLAENGHQVTVLEMRDTLAADTTLIHYRSMFQEAWEALDNFSYVLNASCTGIKSDEVIYLDQNGVERSVKGDSVVVSVGMRPKLRRH